jgi:protein-serine/threonine kinase
MAAAKKTAAKVIGRDTNNEVLPKGEQKSQEVPEIIEPEEKKTIDDFVILEEMGQGAYGQVKLARYKKNGNRKVVLKYVTKRRILVDTWTRDRRLGTVPLEIHVLDYLRRDGLKHPNIVEMADFFEDDVNYYIEMVPHGLPGMDLFDYIELRVNMEENECRSIFVQVVKAIHHLHTKAFVVHRDIKDENVVLDGEGNIKLIDFGSAAYIKSGPFDVFVGTIGTSNSRPNFHYSNMTQDYAAPEVLAGKPYRGKEQDIWALGILLYTIIYKENPFYSIDEIMDRELRIPYVMSEDSIDLIRRMLDRNVDTRITIEQVIEHPWCTATEDD